jgi:glycerol-1-phosphate dehydrogenase [NAD(P)+]
MLSRVIRVPRFFNVDENLVPQINTILANEKIDTSRTLIVSGSTSTRTIGDYVASNLDGNFHRVIINGNNSVSITSVRQALWQYKPSLIVGVGGGKVLDVTKYCSSEIQKPFIAIPTILSNDGVSSPVAVIQINQGIESIGVNPPVGIIVDIDVVKTGSQNALLSGVGDLVSNLSAIEDWILANRHAGERIDKFAEILSKSSAERFLHHAIRSESTNDLIISLAEGLIQSGIAMSLAGSSRPCSGSEHLISHALDRILDSPKSHGLQVGVATLFTMALRNKNVSEIQTVFEKLRFPTNPETLGVSMSVFMKAVKMAPLTRSGRFTILNMVSDVEFEEARRAAYGS